MWFGVDQAVDVVSVWATDDVAGTLVLQVDQEHVIQLADVRRRYGERSRGELLIADGERLVVGVCAVVVAEERVVVGKLCGHLGGGGARRDRPGDVAFLKPGETQAIPYCDRVERVGAQNLRVRLVAVEGDLHGGSGRVPALAAEIGTQRERRSGCAVELDGLTDAGRGHGSAAGEIVTTPCGRGLWKVEKLRERSRESERITAVCAVGDHGRGTALRPARNGHPAEAGPGRVGRFEAGVDQQILTHRLRISGGNGRGLDVAEPSD